MKKIRGRLSRTAGAGTIEALENVAGEAGSDAVRETMEKFDMLQSDESQDALATVNRENEANMGSRYLKSAEQGFIAGSVIAAPVAVGAHASEVAQRKADVAGKVLEANDELTGQKTAAEKAAADKAKRTADTEKAYAAKQEQEKAAEQAKADQQEADFRNADIARTVAANPNSLGRAALIKWTPEMVAQERTRTAAKAAEAEQTQKADQEMAARKKIADDIAKRKATLTTQQKVAEATALKEKEKADKAAAAQRYNNTRDQLIKDNPDATPEELADKLTAELAKPVVAPTAPKAGRKARKAAVTAVETPAAPAATEAATEAPPVDIQELATRAKAAMTTPLGMAQTKAEEQVAPDNPNRPALVKKVHAVVGALVGDNSQTSVDIQNVLHQKKLILASNPEEVGRTSENAAEYDPETGKMYVYLDRVNAGGTKKAIVKAMHEAAVHESTHAGQLNTREGRGSLMHTVLGATKYNAAHKAILAAAKSGNKLAQKAVALAQADTKSHGNDNSNEHLEVVGYFAGEAAKARQGYGRLGGVVRDITAGTKDFARRKLKMDIDFSLSDIEAGTQRAVGEVAKTELKPTSGKTTLAMIIPTRAASSMPGLDRVYQDPVDREHKFVISDQLSAITERPEKIRQVLNGEVKLSQLMSHDELYKQMPSMKNITVSALKNAPPNTGAQAFPHEHAIEVHPILLERAAEGLPYAAEQLRDVLLHEVQHVVQHQGKGSGGGNSGIFFTPEEVNILRAQKLATKQAKEAAIALLNEVDAPVSKDASPESLVEDAKDVAQLVKDTGEDGYSKHTLNLADETLQASDRLERVKNKTNDLFSKYHADYENIHGEREARFTAANRNKSLENLPVNPTAIAESAGGLPGRNDEAHVTTRDPNGNQFLTTAADRKAAMARPVTLGMAVDNSDLYEKKPSHLYTKEEVIRGADLIAAMSEDERDNMEPWDAPGGIAAYHYYEARKLLPKPSDKFKKVTDDNSFQLYSEAEYVANVDGTLFGINKFEDPDDEDETVWAFQRMDDARGTTTETTTNDKGEAIKEMRATLSARPLGMAASNERKPNKIPLVLSRLFSSTAGTTPEIREALESAQSWPSGEIRQAEHILGNYQNGLDALARERNTTPSILGDEIVRALDAVDRTSDDYATNFKAFKAVAAKYGEAGKALVDFRNQVDRLSLNMITDRAAQGTKLTKEEEERYTTIFNNLGRYAHRQFATNLGDAGKKFSKAVWADYAKVAANKGEGEGSELNNYERVARAVGALVDDITIPEDLDEVPADKVRKLYDVWGDVGNPASLSTDEMRDELDSMRDVVNGDKDAMVREAEEIAKQIMGIAKTSGLIGKSYRGGKLDTGILQERTHMNPAIRELMGEIKEPGMKMFVTVGKVAEFIARNRSLAELTKMNDPQNIQPPGPASRPEVKGMIKLREEEYGPMQGYYVSPNLHGLLSSHVQQLATYETAVAMALAQPKELPERVFRSALSKWMGVAAFTKAFQLFTKPVLYLVNFSGGGYQLLKHGNLNPVHTASGVGTALSLLKAAWNPHSDSPRANRALTAGITDSVFTGDVNLGKRNEILKLLNEMSGKSPNVIYQTGMKYIQKGVLTGKEFYSMMDVVWKLANWHQQADAVLPAYYKAAGETKTPAQIDREAADITNKTNLTFKRLPAIIKGLERGGATMYGGFMWGTIATEVANVQQGIAELKRANAAPNDEAAAIMRLQGTKRLAGQLAAWGALATVSSLLSKAAFGDDDDKNKKIRAMLYEPVQGHDFVHVGQDEKGNPVLYEISATDPAGPAHDIFRDAFHKEASIEELASGIYGLYILPRIGAKLVKAALVATGAVDQRVPNPTLQNVAPEFYAKLLEVTRALGIEENTVRAWTGAAELGVLPGALAAQRPNNPQPKPDTMGGVAGAAIRAGGGTLYVIDPAKNATSAHYDYVDSVKEGRKQIKEMLKDNPTITEGTMLQYATRAVKNERDNWDKIKVVYDGMGALGYNQARIEKTLKEAGVKPKTIASLRDGVFRQTVISDKSFTGQIADLPADEKKKLMEQWNNTKRILMNTTGQEATND